jgi:hypothetical protein
MDNCLTHIPVILFKGNYWTLSLRMSKCIDRHIRLRKGFDNIQNVHGVQTLRIPKLLLNEKKKHPGQIRGLNLYIPALCLPSLVSVSILFFKHRVPTYKLFSLYDRTENAHQKPSPVQGGKAALLYQTQVYCAPLHWFSFQFLSAAAVVPRNCYVY